MFKHENSDFNQKYYFFVQNDYFIANFTKYIYLSKVKPENII
jgi:hypothetical protein